MSTVITGLDLSKFVGNRTLNYAAKVAIAHTDNAITTFTEDGAILFYNPHTAATVYDLPMFNGELYDGETKLMDLNYSTNTPSATLPVRAGMSYKCLKWSVIIVYADTEDEVGTYQPVSTDCALYFVPYLYRSTTEGESPTSGSSIISSADFVGTYNDALGDTSILDEILNEGESESESES